MKGFNGIKLMLTLQCVKM